MRRNNFIICLCTIIWLMWTRFIFTVHCRRFRKYWFRLRALTNYIVFVHNCLSTVAITSDYSLWCRCVLFTLPICILPTSRLVKLKSRRGREQQVAVRTADRPMSCPELQLKLVESLKELFVAPRTLVSAHFIWLGFGAHPYGWQCCCLVCLECIQLSKFFLEHFLTRNTFACVLTCKM